MIPSMPPPEVMSLLFRRFAGRGGPRELTGAELRALAPWLDVNRPDGLLLHYDRRGRAISMWEWAARMEDSWYRIVRQTHLPNGYEVSTVWIGIGAALRGPPGIFESMVFGPPSEPCERYASEAEALAGHAELVKRWTYRKRNPRRAMDRGVTCERVVLRRQGRAGRRNRKTDPISSR